MWEQRHPAGQTTSLEDGAVAIDTDGSDIFTAGFRRNNANAKVIETAKYDVSGNLLASATWPLVVGTSYNAEAVAIAAVSIVGEPQPPTVFVTGKAPGLNGTWNIVTIAYLSGLDQGKPIWSRIFNHQPSGTFHGDDIPVDIEVLGGHVIVTGTSMGVNTSEDIVVCVYDLNTGDDIVSPIRYATAGKDTAAGVAVINTTSRIFVAGTTVSSGYRQFVTLAYDSTNSYQNAWTQIKQVSGINCDAVDIEVTDNDGVFVMGDRHGPSPDGDDIMTVKYSWSGTERYTVLSETAFDNHNDLGSDLKAVGAGTKSFFWVTGSTTSGGNTDQLAIQYYEDLNGGVHDWWWAEFGSSNYPEVGIAVDVVPGGGSYEIYIAGRAWNGSDWNIRRSAYFSTYEGHLTTAYQPYTLVRTGDDTPAGVVAGWWGTYPGAIITGQGWSGHTSGMDFLTVRVDDTTP